MSKYSLILPTSQYVDKCTWFTHCGHRYRVFGNQTDEKRRVEEIVTEIVATWIYVHGTPGYLSAEDAFNRPTVRKELKNCLIGFKQRPTQWQYKWGIIERKNGTIKWIMDRIGKDNTDSSATIMVTKEWFISNWPHASKILSSFEFSWGYDP